jgi:hypothetical protein
MRTRLLSSLAFVLFAACGGGGRPSAPEVNDPAYAISGKEWYLVGNAATPGDETVKLTVAAKAGTESVEAWIGAKSDEGTPFVLQGDGTFVLELPAAQLPVGDHETLLVANGGGKAFARIVLHRSAPYYVIVTTDWDFSDPGDTANNYQMKMHVDHPELVMTHFVGPYTFTDPMLAGDRRTALVNWLLMMRDTYKDEIGLHIHPYCHFVQSAGLTCVTDQSTVYPGGSDVSGYTIKLSAYTREQAGQLFDHANMLFQQNGLNKTRTFRAGGWTASLATLQALADKGFIADTSALNWARIEEWKGGIPGQRTGELYRWNMENWNPINDTSQPYWVSESNVLTSDAPTMPILEVPDNGAMIDYVTLEEMNGLFDTNWDRAALESPKTLMMGFHPSKSFSAAEYGRVDGFLSYADSHLAAWGLGPVVYITLENVVAAYRP